MNKRHLTINNNTKKRWILKRKETANVEYELFVDVWTCILKLKKNFFVLFPIIIKLLIGLGRKN